MPVLYALPFFLLSLVAGIICLAIPRLRRYLLAACLGPIAFGFWSVISMGVAVLIGDRYEILDGRWYLFGFSGASLVLLAYFLPGLLGAWLSVRIAKRLGQHFWP